MFFLLIFGCLRCIQIWCKFRTEIHMGKYLKVDMPILSCVFYTFNWLILTSEMYFVRFHPQATSWLLSRGKTKYATLGMRLWCKYIRNYLLVYQLTSHFLPYLQNYKESEGEISDLQLEKYGLSFETQKYTTSGWSRGDDNVIGIRGFKMVGSKWKPLRTVSGKKLRHLSVRFFGKTLLHQIDIYSSSYQAFFL